MDTGYWIQDTGYRILNTGYWIKIMKCNQIQNTG